MSSTKYKIINILIPDLNHEQALNYVSQIDTDFNAILPSSSSYTTLPTPTHLFLYAIFGCGTSPNATVLYYFVF